MLALLGVLAVLGAGLLRPQLGSFRLMHAARLLQADAQALRSLAMSTGREARLRFTVTDAALDADAPGAGVWLLQLGNRSTGSTVWDTLPLDEHGVADDGEGVRDIGPDGTDPCPGVSLAALPELRGPGLGNEDSVVFSPRGWVTNPSADFPQGYIVARLVNKRTPGQEVNVRLSRVGILHLDRGDEGAAAENAVGAPEASSP